MSPSIEDIAHAFAPIAEAHGLECVDKSDGQRERMVTFSSDEVMLRVIVTVTSDIHVTIGAAKGLRFGIHELTADRLDRIEDSADGLARAVALAQEHGKALLEGDFSAFPELRRRRAVRTREQNVERFGTSTGETPRFDSRPTLEQLFDDATNDGIKTARCYQAIWDYEYTREELASFLGEDIAAIQTRLDQWDGLA